MTDKCKTCDDSAWVCENHLDRPWRGVSNAPNACKCGAGAPCPVCNTPKEGEAPRMPPDTDIIFDATHGWRH